jgi:tetratricopeptide (TPR) repeat protein
LAAGSQLIGQALGISGMKAIDLNSIPYEHRFNGASLLISKANRLGGLGPPDQKANNRKLLAALAYYDMALALMKPFDPNYSAVVNWKCNVLRSLGQYEDAVIWYREILRISDEIDGKARRNAAAALADEMIQQYAGRRNEPLEIGSADAAAFNDPPYCMFAEEFCVVLSEGKFKKAHLYLSPSLKETWPAARLKAEWQQMTGKTHSEEMDLTLEQHIVDWPDRNSDDVGWCYFSVSAAEFREAVTVVVGRMPDNSYRITQLELSRP